MSDSGKTYMTKDAASRIQSSEAKKNDGRVEKGSWAARAQSAADTNVNKGYTSPPGGGGGISGGEKFDSGKTFMSQEAAARIQSSQAQKTGGQTLADSFAARAQSAADKNAIKGITPSSLSREKW